MHWQYTPYSIPLLLLAAVAVAFMPFLWRRRTAPGATALMVLMLAASLWSLGYALELTGADLGTKVFWAQVQYLAIVTMPLGWLAFALQYTNREGQLTTRNLALLSAMPLATVILVWTNASHALIWTYTGLDASGPFLALDTAYGPWFWAHTAYSYLLLALASIQLIVVMLRSPDLYRRQSGALLFGLLLPWVSNGLYLSGLVPVPNLDLTPFAFAFSGIAFVVGLFRLRLLDIAPVARRAVVDGISDGVIVLDTQNRLVDLNPVAERLIGRPAAEVIGKAASQVLAAYAELLDEYRDVMETSAEITLWSDVSGTKFGPRPEDSQDAAHHYELRISPLTDQAGQPIARVVVLHEITARKQVERALRIAREELEARVEERTAQLAKLNRELLSEIDERVRAEKERERLIGELQEALDEVKVLRGILPICMSCKKIRDDEGYWQDVALYIEERSEAEFTHGICPDCARKLYPDFYSG